MNEPQRNFYVTGGTLQRNAPSYVRRQADVDLYEGLSAGKFCYVLTSRQMGKSSLMVQTAARLREEGVAVAVLDLTAMGQNLTAEQWYDGLLNRTGQQLHLEDELEDFWLDNERVGPLQRWMRALREVVLERHTGRIVIFIDEIDAVRSLPFSTDEFFAAIREFYNRRTEDAELQRLTFCLLGVATPSDLIRDTRTTPFNIGQRIELTDFKEAEAKPLAAGLGHDDQLGAKLLERILYWTGGHPYLTQRLCLAAAEHAGVTNPAAIDRLCDAMFFSARARESDDNLLFVRERILRSEADRAALLDLYAQVRAHRQRVRDDETNPLVSILRLAGITRIAEGYHYVRNRIYYRVFDREWINANMPDAELRRQRAAYRRGMARTAAVAAVILFLMAGLAFSALREKRHADRETRIAVEERRRADEKTREAEAALIEVRQERERAIKLQAIAEDEQAEAEAQRKEAEAQRKEAISQKEIAQRERAATERERQQTIVESQRRLAAQRLASESTKEAVAAKSAELQTRRLLYASDMSKAQEAWQDANIGRMQKLLSRYEQPAAPDSANAGNDMRGFEWRYLWRLANGTLQTKQLAQPGEAYLTAFAPGGEKLALASAEARITQSAQFTASIWDTVSGRPPVTLNNLKSPVNALTFSPDGMKIVTKHDDARLRLWDAKTGAEMPFMTMPTPTAEGPDRRGAHHSTPPASGAGTPVKFKRASFAPGIDSNDDGTNAGALAFSPDGRLLAASESGRNVALWDMVAQKKVATLTDHAERITALAFAPDNKFLATGSADNMVKLWPVWPVVDVLKSQSGAQPSPTLILTFEQDVTFIAFSPDGKTLAIGNAGNTVTLWDVQTKQRVGPVYSGHTAAITFIAFSPDSRKFATGSADKTIKLWRVPERAAATPTEKGPTVEREEGSRLSNPAVRFRPAVYPSEEAGNVFSGFPFSAFGPATPAPMLGAFLTTREKPPEPLVTLKGHGGAVLSIMFTSDGRRLLTASGDDTIKTWAVETEPEWLTLGEYERAVYALAFSPDGKLIAAGGQGDEKAKTLRVWDRVSGKELFALAAGAGIINNVAFSPDSQTLAVAGTRATSKLWDVRTGQSIRMLWEPPEVSSPLQGIGAGQSAGLIKSRDLFSIVFSHDGKLLATGSSAGDVSLVDPETGETLRLLAGHTKGVEAVAFSPDDKRLVTASHDGTLRLWDVVSGSELAKVEVDPQGVRAVSFNPDGTLLATGGADRTARLWDVSGPQPLAVSPPLEGHADMLTYLSFSADGKRLATSSQDGTVRLWDVISRQEVAVLKGHKGAAWTVGFSPDGQTIATTGQDGTVRLWRANAKQSLSR